MNNGEYPIVDGASEAVGVTNRQDRWDLTGAEQSS